MDFKVLEPYHIGQFEPYFKSNGIELKYLDNNVISYLIQDDVLTVSCSLYQGTFIMLREQLTNSNQVTFSHFDRQGNIYLNVDIGMDIISVSGLEGNYNKDRPLELKASYKINTLNITEICVPEYGVQSKTIKLI